MKQVNLKKIVLPNLPYVFIALLGTKLGEAARLASGTDFSEKALHYLEGLALAFQSALPSFHPADLCVGIITALLIRLAVYIKGKDAKKFRKNLEYGSARWGTAEDIRPYVDPVFENNIILTQTESLTMNNRPKDLKTARNKNVLVIGGSGSGKTFRWLKPNLLQCTSKEYPVSFVVTDPNGYNYGGQRKPHRKMCRFLCVPFTAVQERRKSYGTEKGQIYGSLRAIIQR